MWISTTQNFIKINSQSGKFLTFLIYIRRIKVHFMAISGTHFNFYLHKNIQVKVQLTDCISWLIQNPVLTLKFTVNKPHMNSIRFFLLHLTIIITSPKGHTRSCDLVKFIASVFQCEHNPRWMSLSIYW